ncbi:pilus assembly protein [Iamia sp. SCSIO 61187]|nr:pilus assembly protein [Iamia sp. SCSIO 61187]
MAIVLPLLVMIIFGTIDFGWTFTRSLDVRHGAREGTRLVAVNYNPGGAYAGTGQANVIATEICRRMDDAAGATVTITLPDWSAPATAVDGTVEAEGKVGDTVEVEVQRPGQSLTGMFAPILEDRPVRSTVTGRLEVESTWTTTNGSYTKACS